MKCYYHPQLDAVAVCKNCSKALCADCAVDVGGGMACRGKCEADVIAINEVIRRNKELPAQLAKLNKQIVIWTTLLGLLILVMGVISWSRGKGPNSVIVGAIFLFFALFYYTGTRKHRSHD